MRKILFVLAVAIALQISFVSCQQNGKDATASEKGDTVNGNDSSTNKGVYKEYIYEFYSNLNRPEGTEGLDYCGIAKRVYKDGEIEYSSYMKFSACYSNTYTTNDLALTESNLSMLLEFIDSCNVYKKNRNREADELIRCDIVEQEGSGFAYDGDLMVFVEDNRYNFNMPLKELRNIISGLKIKIESLKEGDAAKNNKK